ncbi:hypothetical protein B0T25DRAFT_528211 [Lasiosphaeria hispida]|uniref:Tim44-like domain-containing protein n=1 Tax=Lasiosphaeria hispida TaxID=260671 RepID=A0AAJ0HVI7_9PEZI|nr:hypothetical protein B0T25DRAFT_528211 [Lasiosphaeria hispida]
MASALGLRGARGPMWKRPATGTFMTTCGLAPAVVWPKQLPAIAIAPPTARFYSPTAASYSYNTYSRFNQNQQHERQKAPQSPQVYRANRSTEGFISEHVSLLYPLTFVSPPLFAWPRNPIKAWKFFMGWAEGHGRAFLSNTVVKWSSKGSLFKRAKYNPDRDGVKLMARAMHRSLGEAMASGDELTLQKTCTQVFARTLIAPIKARGTNLYYEWELMRYTGASRISSDMIQPFQQDHIDCLVRQTIVTVPSRQRRVQWKRSNALGAWQVVPGSEKEVDLVEYVALTCVYDSKTYQPTNWRIMGTLKPTTLQSWLTEKEGVNILGRQEAKGHNILDEE